MHPKVAPPPEQSGINNSSPPSQRAFEFPRSANGIAPGGISNYKFFPMCCAWEHKFLNVIERPVLRMNLQVPQRL